MQTSRAWKFKWTLFSCVAQVDRPQPDTHVLGGRGGACTYRAGSDERLTELRVFVQSQTFLLADDRVRGTCNCARVRVFTRELKPIEPARGGNEFRQGSYFPCVM